MRCIDGGQERCSSQVREDPLDGVLSAETRAKFSMSSRFGPVGRTGLGRRQTKRHLTDPEDVPTACSPKYCAPHPWTRFRYWGCLWHLIRRNDIRVWWRSIRPVSSRRVCRRSSRTCSPRLRLRRLLARVLTSIETISRGIWRSPVSSHRTLLSHRAHSGNKQWWLNWTSLDLPCPKSAAWPVFRPRRRFWPWSRFPPSDWNSAGIRECFRRIYP